MKLNDECLVRFPVEICQKHFVFLSLSYYTEGLGVKHTCGVD